jgi:hypothetical protein
MSYPVLLNMGLLQPSLATGLLTMLSYAQMLRGIKKLGSARRHKIGPTSAGIRSADPAHAHS